VKPELVEKYVEDGTLRIEWRDFPYQGQESVNAALAARAAGEQGRFWEYHDLLYENQGSGNSGAFSDENLTEFARKLGLDMERFESDFRSEEIASAVQADFEAGQRAGISGTPTFEVNGQRLVGFQPLETFEGIIEEQAGKAEDAS
jgi:protein-disulfide isomerase